jgi:hypothetical protein
MGLGQERLLKALLPLATLRSVQNTQIPSVRRNVEFFNAGRGGVYSKRESLKG